MSDETPDVGVEVPKKPGQPSGPITGPYGPYAGQSVDDMKVWYESKAMLTTFASFGLYLLKHFGIIDWANDMILQVQGFFVTLGLFFARIGNKRLVTRKTYKEAEAAQNNRSEDAEPK
jgi:hypothetical protein